MPVDFGRTAADYAAHRAPFPERFYLRLERSGLAIQSKRVLDLGTGTGALARGLARRGARVVALDRSQEMVRAARGLDERAPVEIRYVVARAEATGLAGDAFDLVTAGQCWWWFDAARAFAEARRVLAPGGTLVLASYDWLPRAGNVVADTETLILRHNPGCQHAGGHGLHAEWVAEASSAGFEEVESFSTDVLEPYSHVGWRGRVRASAGVGASLSPAAVERFDTELADLLRARFPAEPLAVEHRVYCVLARRPGTSGGQEARR